MCVLVTRQIYIYFFEITHFINIAVTVLYQQPLFKINALHLYMTQRIDYILILC